MGYLGVCCCEEQAFLTALIQNRVWDLQRVYIDQPYVVAVLDFVPGLKKGVNCS